MKNMKKLFILFLMSLLVLCAFPAVSTAIRASSSTSYTYALDDENEFVRTQDAYLPGQTITALGLNKPTDLAIDNDNNLVIANSGASAVEIYDPIADAIIRTITNPQMINPSGVFVVRETSAYVSRGDLYVADPTAKLVFHFDETGTLIETFGKPDSIMFETIEFQPLKISVDKAGIMYIISEGTSDGIVQLSNNGEFLGFFASNKVQLNLREQIQQAIYTDEQLESLGLNLTPPVFTSVYIDEDGIVYSSSSGQAVENIKKHNTQGNNMIAEMFIVSSQLSDIYVDQYGIIYASDQTGWIDVYTNDGEFIYTFGAYSDVSVAGFFKTLAGIAVDASGKIWTVDSGNNYLQSFVPTEYANTIYQAITLYNETQYDQSIELWQSVLRLNQMSILAHNGLAKNYLQVEEYQLAADHFKIAGNRELFSEAFWELRNIWLQANLLPSLGLIIFGLVGYFVLKWTNKKYRYLVPVQGFFKKIRETRIIDDVLYAREVIKKPADAFYYLRKKKKGSYLGAAILFLITFLSYLLYVAGKGFIFQYTALKNMDLSSIILGFVAIFGLFVVCSYLVTSIQDGEGTIGEIFKGISYSMWPFILGCIGTTLFSYIATNNELFLLSVIFGLGLGTSLLLVFISISEIQNYTFGQTIKSVLFTIVFILIILLVFSFLQMTIGQLYHFFEEIIKEAIRNAFNL